MTFGTPLALLGLLVVPFLIVMLALGERRRRSKAAAFGTPALLAASLPAPRPIRRLLPFALALVALSALIVGVARPRATLSVPDRSATVVLALDVSRSMSATDVKPSRLAAALESAKAFLEVAPKDFAVGIVTFSTSASVALSPTTDRDAARAALDQIRLGSGTALGDAVDRSVTEARSGLEPAEASPRRRATCDGRAAVGRRADVRNAERRRPPPSRRRSSACPSTPSRSGRARRWSKYP